MIILDYLVIGLVSIAIWTFDLILYPISLLLDLWDKITGKTK